MITIGVESTAHTFGVGIVEFNKGAWKILANEKSMYKSPLGQGMKPQDVAEHHYANADLVINKALEKAKLRIGEIDRVSFSQGPGLGPCLSIGAVASRAISLAYKKPIVGVNHCVAHMEIGRALTPAKDPVMLYASGGNTQIVAFEAGRYRVFGETQDIPIGNMLDVFARNLELPMPGGPEVENLASRGNNYIPLPYSIKGMDFSFSGILTNATNKIDKYAKDDIAYSLQETAFAMLIEAAERAMAHCGKSELLLAGGVVANKRLREMADIMAKERGAKCYAPEFQFCTDNGAMIAVLGSLAKTVQVSKTAINPKWRTDEVDVAWR